MLKANKNIQASRILFINEVLQQKNSLIGIAVKFIGRAIFYDPTKDILLVEYQKARIAVSTALTDGIKIRCGQLLQLIGEISPSDEASYKFCQQVGCLVATRQLNLKVHYYLNNRK
jgi:hypothetical protein